MKLFNISFLCFFIFCSVISAGTRDPIVPDSKYCEFGKKFPFVGRIYGKNEDGSIFFASAVAIKDKIILTAAHVVEKSSDCVLHINDKQILIKKIVCHEEFKEDNFGYCDIALCSMEEEINLKFYPELYLDNDEIKKACTISGFGLNGTFESGAIHSDLERRAGSNKIDTVEKGLLICTPSLRRRDSDLTSLEFLISSGDSGGGLFIGNRVAGINSCIIARDKKLDSSYGDESGHTRISDNIEWINRTIESLEE